MDIDRDLEQIATQEKTLRFAEFNQDTACKLGMLLREMALDAHAPVAIDVSLFAMPLFYVALDGATPDNVDWIRRKRNIVQRFLRSSYATGLTLARQKTTLEEKFLLSPSDYAAHGGSFPLHVRKTGVVGAVTVSGLPQRDDHAMVVAALCRLLGKDVETLRLP